MSSSKLKEGKRRKRQYYLLRRFKTLSKNLTYSGLALTLSDVKPTLMPTNLPRTSVLQPTCAVKTFPCSFLRKLNELLSRFSRFS